MDNRYTYIKRRKNNVIFIYPIPYELSYFNLWTDVIDH